MAYRPARRCCWVGAAMKVHYDQHLADGTFIPQECNGPYDIQPVGEYVIGEGPDLRGVHIECKSCGAVTDLPSGQPQ